LPACGADIAKGSLAIAVDRVDVILPTHKRPDTVEYSIRAVLQQTHPHLELHVVGDGCDDATEAVVRSVDDPRVRFHRFPKGMGLGYAHRNHVLHQTTGAYVAYAADDDLWLPDHLERALAEMRQHTLAFVAFRECPVLYPDALDPYFFAFDWHLGPPSALLRNWFLGAGSGVHRRTVFDQVGYWNEELARFGDREFFHRVRTSGMPWAYRDEVHMLRFYAQHWDRHYATLPEPPQRRYLMRTCDPQWVASVRRSAARGRRSLAVRWRQWVAFLRFGSRSGPKLVRLWYQQLRSAGAKPVRHSQGLA
jgi:glycosyltransferase involved in cell wall biosynthesis